MTTEIEPEGGAGETRGTQAGLNWRAWILILAVTGTVCCFKLGSARSLTEHEIYVAAGAKQMAQDHDWLLPKVGDHLWLEKPPLLHWLTIATATLSGGFSESAVRLPSVLAGVGVVIIVSLLTFRWFGRRVAVFAALLQTTMVYFVTYARLAEAEMLLAFIVVLALFVFVRLHSIGQKDPEPQPRLALPFWLLVGVSNMAKGLGFGPALILSPCVTFLLLKRDPAAWRRTISWPGIALGMAIAVAWPLTVALNVPEAREIWRQEIERRATGGPGYYQPWWYYLATVPWQLLPWTLTLLIAAPASLGQARRQPASADRFIWCWGIVPIVLLSMFSGKHHHYIISCLCAFTPLSAMGLLRFGTRFAAGTVAVVVAGILVVHASILPKHDRSRDDRDFLRSVRSLVPPGAPLAATGGREIARHIFYVDPPPDGIWNPNDLSKRFNRTPFYLIARGREQSQLEKLGKVEKIAESRHSRNEKTPADRFGLFKIAPVQISP